MLIYYLPTLVYVVVGAIVARVHNKASLDTMGLFKTILLWPVVLVQGRPFHSYIGAQGDTLPQYYTRDELLQIVGETFPVDPTTVTSIELTPDVVRFRFRHGLAVSTVEVAVVD